MTLTWPLGLICYSLIVLLLHFGIMRHLSMQTVGFVDLCNVINISDWHIREHSPPILHHTVGCDEDNNSDMSNPSVIYAMSNNNKICWVNYHEYWHVNVVVDICQNGSIACLSHNGRCDDCLYRVTSYKVIIIAISRTL